MVYVICAGLGNIAENSIFFPGICVDYSKANQILDEIFAFFQRHIRPVGIQNLIAQRLRRFQRIGSL